METLSGRRCSAKGRRRDVTRSCLGSSGCSLCIVLFGTWIGIQVTVGGSKSDAKQLLPDYEKFIPSDAPNHDDWNEFFNEPAKLEDKLILNDGSKFFMSDPAEMLGLFEFYSMWDLFASRLRVWFLHILIPRRCSAFKWRWCVARWKFPRGCLGHSRLAGSVARPFSGSYRDGLSPEQLGGTGPSR